MRFNLHLVYNPCNPVFAQRQADCIVCVHRHCVCIQAANRIHHSRSALLLDFDKEISILHFFIIPAVDVIMCLPAIIMGRPFIDIITIYAEQTDYGKLIQMNCPNFYALICDGNDMTYYYLFKQFSVFLTIAVLGIMMCIIIYKRLI